MRTPQIVSALVVGLAVAAPSLHAQDAARGAALLAEARKAIGGADKLAAIKRLQASGTFLRSTGPDQIIDGDFDVLIELPDKYRKNEVTGFAGATVDRIEVLNGADIWDETSGGLARGGGFGGGGGGFPRGGDRGGGGFRGGGGGGGFGGGRQGQARGGTDTAQAGQPQGGPQIDPARIKEQQRRVRQAEMARLALVWLLTTDAPVAWIGIAESPEGTADVLEVKPPDGIATRLFLEPNTHIPLMITWEGQAPRGNGLGNRGTAAQRAPRGDAPPAGRRGGAAQGGAPQAQTTLELHLTEYKVVNGVKLPHLITRGSDGITQEEWKIKSFKINPNFKGDTFTQ